MRIDVMVAGRDNGVARANDLPRTGAYSKGWVRTAYGGGQRCKPSSDQRDYSPSEATPTLQPSHQVRTPEGK